MGSRFKGWAEEMEKGRSGQENAIVFACPFALLIVKMLHGLGLDRGAKKDLEL
jgi:hypothetical protein